MALTKDQYVFRVEQALGYFRPCFPLPKRIMDDIEKAFEIGYSTELCAYMIEKGCHPQTVGDSET